MSKGETIAYAIEDKCCEFSLEEFCNYWGFTTDDFEEFISFGIKGFDGKGKINETDNG